MGEADQQGATRAGARVEVECLSCGRHGSFAADDRRVAGLPLVRLTKRLRCSECGSRAVKARAVRAPRDIARNLSARMPGRRG